MGTTNKRFIKGMNNAFNRFYSIEMNDGLSQLYNVLSGNDFWNKIQNLFTKASDALTSLRGYPITAKVLENGDRTDWGENIWLADQQWKVKCNPLCPTNMYSINVIHYKFPEPQSWIDLEPYTQIQLYLPYMDFIELPANEVMGNILKVDYAFDLATGVCTAFINIIKNDVTHIIAIKNAKLGIDVAWGENNSVENTRNIINTVISTGVSIATLGLAPVNPNAFAGETIKRLGIGASASKGVLGVMNSLQTRYTRGGNAGCLNNLFAPNTPYLIIKKPKLVPVNELDYAHTYGKPLYESRVLAELTGFTVVDEIHLTGLPDALDDEVTEIENLLKSGVHL